METRIRWWSIVTWGRLYDGPHGPWQSEADANEALMAWRLRKGAEAGTIEAASALSVVGPFGTRANARRADISDYPRYVIRDD